MTATEAALRSPLAAAPRLAVGEVVERVAETPPGDHARPRRPGLARPSRGPARRRPAHRGGRLPGPAQLLDRLPARGAAARAHGRAARGRRGVALARRRGPAGRPVRAARADRRLLRLVRRRGRAAAARRGRLGHRAADGHAAPPRGKRRAGRAVPARLLLSARSLADIIYREELERLGSAPGGPRSSTR